MHLIPRFARRWYNGYRARRWATAPNPPGWKKDRR